MFGYIPKLKPAMGAFYSEIVALVTILLVIPATNATSERTFSALRRVKTYLRSTMTQTRMNTCTQIKNKRSRLGSNRERVHCKKRTQRSVFGKF